MKQLHERPRQAAEPLEQAADRVALAHVRGLTSDPAASSPSWTQDTARRSVGSLLGVDLSSIAIRGTPLNGAPPGALARTRGHVEVSPDAPGPNLAIGQALLAHELTHVVQQGGARPVGLGPEHEEARERVGTAPAGMSQYTLSGCSRGCSNNSSSSTANSSSSTATVPVGSSLAPAMMTPAQLASEVSAIDQWLLGAANASHAQFVQVMARLVEVELDQVRRRPRPPGTHGSPFVISDLWHEMIGRTFTLRSAQGGLSTGASVTVVYWSRTQFRAVVRSGNTTVTVPKHVLNPSVNTTRGVSRYLASTSGTQASYTRDQGRLAAKRQELSDWLGRESQYVRNRAVWERGRDRIQAEITRLERVQPGREAAISRGLIRQTMYNRFDPNIRRWVDHYNNTRRPARRLDANLVKSMLFQESRMGTHGQHLKLPPYTAPHLAVKSPRNLGQAIDTWHLQQFILMRELAPALFRRHNLHLLADPTLRRGPREVDLGGGRKRTDKYWEYMTQTEMMAWNNGAFLTAVQDHRTRRDPRTGQNAHGNSDPDLFQSYDYWIRTAVRWLFYKYEKLPAARRSWAEAARAYNGSGAAARHYRDAVMRRTRGDPATYDVSRE